MLHSAWRGALFWLALPLSWRSLLGSDGGFVDSDLTERWFELEPYGRVFAYDAETCDPPELGLSAGFIHFGRSKRRIDRLGFAGVNWFRRNAREEMDGYP